MSQEYPFNDEEKRKFLAEGLSLKYPPFTPGQSESAEDRAARTIQSSWLMWLLQSQDHIITPAVHIENAVIEGDIYLQYMTFQGEFSIVNSTFLGNVDFSFSSFQKIVRFNESTFEKSSTFRAIIAQYDVEIIRTKFSDDLTFADSHVEQVFNAEGAQFNSAYFNRIRVVKSASFKASYHNKELLPVQFRGDAQFISANFLGEAHFEGAKFHKGSYFRLATFGTAAFFEVAQTDALYQRTTFIGECMFSGAHIMGNARFAGALFKSKTAFESVQIDRHAFFVPAIHEKELIPVCFESDVTFYDARIKSNAQFYSAQFEGEANFERIKIEGQALFTPFDNWKEVAPVRFKKDVKFIYSTIGGNLVCRAAHFDSQANFSFATIAGNAVFSAYNTSGKYKATKFVGQVEFFATAIGGFAVFNSTVFKSSVNFQNMRIEGRLVVESFSNSNQLMPTIFEGMVYFAGAHIKLGALFTGTLFELNVDFRSSRIDGNLLFEPAVQGANICFVKFNKMCLFSNALINGDVEFRCVEFRGKVFFDRTQVEGGANFGHFIHNNELSVPKFEDDVSFAGAKIKGDLSFTATKFIKSSNFRLSSIGGNLSFIPINYKDKVHRVEFTSDTFFSGVRISGHLTLTGSIFTGKSYFDRMSIEGETDFGPFKVNKEYYDTEFSDSVSFYSSHFKSQVNLRYAVFKRAGNFTRVRIDNTALFNGALFEGDLSLRDAHINIAIFNGDKEEKQHADRQFLGNIDIVGFSYDRIEVERDALLLHARPFDRQPYTYLEKALRSTGNDVEADKVYLKRRKREGQLTWAKILNKDEGNDFTKREKLLGLFRVAFKRGAVSERKEIPIALFNNLEKWLFNYGVRPYRLIIISIFVIILGFGVFNQPNSVIQRDPRLRTGGDIQLSRGEAFNVSLNQFIPIIEIPPGSEWKPSNKPVPVLGILNLSFAGYATLHRIAGFILIPLGLAALTGRLYRKEK